MNSGFVAGAEVDFIACAVCRIGGLSIAYANIHFFVFRLRPHTILRVSGLLLVACASGPHMRFVPRICEYSNFDLPHSTFALHRICNLIFTAYAVYTGWLFSPFFVSITSIINQHHSSSPIYLMKTLSQQS